MQNESQKKCLYCGSEDIVAGDADWHKRSKEPLILFLFGLAFVLVLFVCLSISKMGYPLFGILLLTFFVIGFVAQYLIRNYLDKRMVITYFCQNCHQSWSK